MHRKPIAICVKNQRIFVTAMPSCILIMDFRASLIKGFASTDKKDGKLDQPKGIGCNSLYEIIVADYGNHVIQVFNQDGQFLRSFAAVDKLAKRPFCPESLCIDEKDNIIVSDPSSSRIYIFTRNGLLINQIDCNCSAVCLWNKKIIGVSDNDIKIFDN